MDSGLRLHGPPTSPKQKPPSLFICVAHICLPRMADIRSFQAPASIAKRDRAESRNSAALLHRHTDVEYRMLVAPNDPHRARKQSLWLHRGARGAALLLRA